MIPRDTADKFGPMLAKLRDELGPHLGTGGGLIEILEGIAGLREKVESQAKEIERMRAALEVAAGRGCMFAHPCSPNYRERDGWCASCIARSALKDGT